MPGCGKEEFIKVCANHGYQITGMGDVVRDEARRRGLDFSDPNVGGMADEERRIHGPDIWARRTLPFVKSTKWVIDGLRSSAELKVFRHNFGSSLKLVAIHSTRETRFQRLVARAREDDILSVDEFDRREERENAWGLGELIRSADENIENNGSLEEFRAAIESLLKELEE
jgi:dephospho-CoA kinase